LPPAQTNALYIRIKTY